MKTVFVVIFIFLLGITYLFSGMVFKPEIKKVSYHPAGKPFISCLQDNEVTLSKEDYQTFVANTDAYLYCFVISGYVDIDQYKYTQGGLIWKEGSRPETMRCIAASNSPPNPNLFDVNSVYF
jgi:hypothetical protein